MPWRPQTVRAQVWRCMGALGATFLCAVSFARPAFAHVGIDTPRSGLTLAVASSVRVTWEDTILHDGIGYELDLIGADEQILGPIVHELPTSVHSYDWQVPDIWCVGCYLMVTQVNRDHDYSDSVLVNIYGKMAAVGSGASAGSGTGGSPDTTQGGAPGQSAGAGGAAGSGASAGVGGTLTSSVGSGAGASGSPDSPESSASAGASGSGKAKPATNGAAGRSAGSSAGSPAAGDAASDEPEESAGDISPARSHSAGCAVDFSGSSPCEISIAAALLSLLLAARRRRVARLHD